VVQRREITATDEEIDRLVYESYELTEEGIAIIDHQEIQCSESSCSYLIRTSYPAIAKEDIAV